MDKNTLSHYGWVIICIIVIAILLGLATPFGNYVYTSVMNTAKSFGAKIVQSFDGNSDNSFDDSGVTKQLDHTVVFKVDNETYQVVSVKEGGLIYEPSFVKISETRFITGWEKDGQEVSFPFAPNSNIVLTAKISEVNKTKYLESTGTQWIDTEIIPTNHRVECKMEITTEGSSSKTYALFGVSNTSSFEKCLGVSYSSGSWNYYSGAEFKQESASPLGIMEFDINNEKGEIVVNGEVVGTASDTSTATRAMTIFGRRTPGSSSVSTSTLVSAKLYYFKIYDKTTGELVRDFIPALDEEGIPCLFDGVTNSYFYNKGTGSFVTDRDDLEKLLYARYNVDPAEYPYIYVQLGQSVQMDFYNVSVYFLSSYELADTGFTGTGIRYGVSRLYHSNTASYAVNSPETFLKHFAAISPSSTVTEITDTKIGAGVFSYTNFDCRFSGTVGIGGGHTRPVTHYVF